MRALSFAVVFVCGGFIVGCSSNRPQSMAEVQRDITKSDELKIAADEKRQQQKQKANEALLQSIPVWALQVPRPDETGLYSVGAGDSESLSVAQKKAMLEAEFGLAKLYRQELSGSERSYTQERNDKSLSTEYTSLIDKLVARVQVVGFEVVKQDIKSISGRFTSYILLKLPYAEFNKVLQEQKAETTDATIKNAFDDLDRRVKERIAERTLEQKAQQELHLTEMKAREDMVGKGVAQAKTVFPERPATTAADQ